jgi:hypothetical protein
MKSLIEQGEEAGSAGHNFEKQATENEKRKMENDHYSLPRILVL